MRIKISRVHKPQEYELVTPNFIYNRFDLFCKPGEFEAVKIQTDDQEKVVEYKVAEKNGQLTAELGLWLTPITKEELEKLVIYIADRHPKVEKIYYQNSTLRYGGDSDCEGYKLHGGYKRHNHFKIVFPETIEEMRSRVSTRTWGKMRRWNARAEEMCGKMQILEYEKENIPLDIVEAFFKFKLETRERVYKMTAKEYLERYHVTNCYVVKFGDTIGAMHFSCEQCPTIYCENHAYNPELRELSLGKFMFIHCLLRMMEKKHEAIFLGGGDFDYKKHYGSIEEEVFDGNITINREKVSTSGTIKRQLKAILPPKVLKLLWKVKNKFK